MTDTRTGHRLLSAVTLTCVTFSAGAVDLPAHPSEIEFPELRFDPPEAANYRHELVNGVSVYLAPSHEFPLLDVTFTFRGGGYLDPHAKIGLASATAQMMRRGGTGTISARRMDEELDFLAAIVSVGSGSITSRASLNTLRSNFEESFARFIDIVREPGFNGERLELYKQEQVQQMSQRNDDARSITGREWDALLFGEKHFEAQRPTEASITSIELEDLQGMHRRIFNPSNLLVAVTGDFEPSWMLEQLERAFDGWEPGEPAGDPPAPRETFTPGVYHVEKDIPQGRVSIGLRSVERDHPDFLALSIMNRILGGGGFTSRIMSRVRSDEGLAYSAGSRIQPRVHYPGTFRAAFQSKSRTVALATRIVLEEIDRIRDEPVDDDELETAVAAVIETFPRRFESKSSMLSVFVNDEMTRRGPNHWKTYRDRVRNITKADIQRVAREYLASDRMAIMVVGKWSDIEPGDLEGRATMGDFFGGSVTHLPLRDPLTLEPMD